MKCFSCGLEMNDGDMYCPHCGAEQTHVLGFKDKVLTAIKSTPFLLMCIFFSISAGMSVISGTIPLINGLLIIFLWMVYAKAKSNNADSDLLRCVSGTVFARYIINWVIVGFVLFSAVLVSFVFSVIKGSEIVQKLIDAIVKGVPQAGLIIGSGKLITAGVISAICVLIAIIVVVFNLFGIGTIHKFTKSLYLSVMNDTDMLVKIKGAEYWLIAFGVTFAISAVFSVGTTKSLIINGMESAAMFAAYSIIKNNFDR